MVDFVCKNCNHIFNKFCDTIDDSINVSCPKCGSHWVEIYYYKVLPEEANGKKMTIWSKIPISSLTDIDILSMDGVEW